MSEAHFLSLPAMGMSWYGARAYCTWLGETTGLPWRLCSESEWEKAARGGCETLAAEMAVGKSCQEAVRLFPWGDDLPLCDLAITWLCGKTWAHKALEPPGSRPAGAGPYGALDMYGNVMQWVEDCDHGVGPELGHPTDGTAWNFDCGLYFKPLYDEPRFEENPGRIVRGAAWDDNYAPPDAPSFIRTVAQRSKHDPADTSKANHPLSLYGIRCCRDFDVAP
jgi:formylglycine-generating enzyme required for sulfatase activity